MTGWSSVGLALVAGLLGIGGTLAAVVLGHWYADRERHDGERRARIEKGAAALAPITILLNNIEPDRLAVNASEQSLRHLGNLRAHWEGAAREPLSAFALSHPSPEVRELANQLDLSVEWVLVRGDSLIRTILARGDTRELSELVWTYYRTARVLIDELHTALHGAPALGDNGEPPADEHDDEASPNA